MSDDELLHVDIEQVKVNPYQPRREFRLEELEELALSIKAVGLLHPPLVRRSGVDDGFELISGERRLRACRLAGLSRIAVVVQGASDERSAQAALIENVHRSDLSAIEVARALDRLVREFGYSQQELAERVGKKRSTVANYLRLLQLNFEEQESIDAGHISIGHAKVLLSVDNRVLRRRLHQLMVSKQISVHTAQKMAQVSAETVEHDPHITDLEQRLSRQLGTRVSIESKRVIIEYHDLNDLDRILEGFDV